MDRIFISFYDIWWLYGLFTQQKRIVAMTFDDLVMFPLFTWISQNLWEFEIAQWQILFHMYPFIQEQDGGWTIISEGTVFSLDGHVNKPNIAWENINVQKVENSW